MKEIKVIYLEDPTKTYIVRQPSSRLEVILLEQPSLQARRLLDVVFESALFDEGKAPRSLFWASSDSDSYSDIVGEQVRGLDGATGAVIPLSRSSTAWTRNSGSGWDRSTETRPSRNDAFTAENGLAPQSSQYSLRHEDQIGHNKNL